MNYTYLLDYAEEMKIGDQPFDTVVSMFVDSIRQSQLESVMDSLFEIFDEDDDIDQLDLKELVKNRKKIRKERRDRKDQIERRVRFDDE
jgi:hypothetical protein